VLLDLIPKNRSTEWVDPYLIEIAVGRTAPEFKSCCGIYLRSCINTHVPALLPSAGLLLNLAITTRRTVGRKDQLKEHERDPVQE
jgi:hypothetical protein